MKGRRRPFHLDERNLGVEGRQRLRGRRQGAGGEDPGGAEDRAESQDEDKEYPGVRGPGAAAGPFLGSNLAVVLGLAPNSIGAWEPDAGACY